MSESKIVSAFQKKVNRLKKAATEQYSSNLKRKKQIHSYNGLVRKLLAEGRVTKEEISQFLIRKKK